jgi:hypothetical protein
VGMFKVMEHYISVDGISEELALDKASAIFNSAKKDSTDKKPGVKALDVAFKAEMDALGIKSTGRPKEQSAIKHSYPKRRKVQQPTTNMDPFQLQFGSNEHTDQERIQQSDADLDNASLQLDNNGSFTTENMDGPLRPNQINDDSSFFHYVPRAQLRNEAHLDMHNRQIAMNELDSCDLLTNFDNAI